MMRLPCILGLLASGLGGLFVMGIFFKRIQGKAALLGFLVGAIALIIIKNYTAISFLLFGFIGIVISVVTALILSYVFPRETKSMAGLTWKTLNK